MKTHEQSSTMRALSTPGLLGPDGIPGLFCHLEEMFSQIMHAGKSAVGPIKGYASLIADDNEYESNTAWWSRKIDRNAREHEGYLARLGMLRLRDAVGVDEGSFDDIIESAVTAAMSSLRRTPKLEITNAATRPFLQHNNLIARILFHIVRNSADAARERVIVAVTEESVADGHRIGREFIVRVTDDGAGIESRNKKLIWEPFFTTRPDHLGLGLPYVIAASAIVDMSVDLANLPEGGTTATLVFRDKGERS